MTVDKSSGNIFKGTLPQLLASISGTLIGASDGMVYGWTSPIVPILEDENSHIKTTKDQGEWLENINLMGALAGIPFTIYLVDKIGRKKSMLLAAVVGFLHWLAIALADRIEILLAARFFGGLAGDMCFVAAPMYIAEIAESKIRGFLSGIIYLMMLIGILIVYSLGPYTPFYVTPVVGMSLTLTQLIVFPFMPESPFYYMYVDKHDEARAALKKLRVDPDVEDELDEIAETVERQKSERGRIQDLVVVRSNRRAVELTCVLNGAQHCAAITVILMNLHLILDEAGSETINTSIAGIIFSVMMLVSATLASFIVDMFGRKLLMVISCITTAACLFAIAIYFHLKHEGVDVSNVTWLPAVSVMVYAAVFKFGMGLVPIVVTAEIFPSKIKAIGMTLADVMYVVMGLVSLYIYQWLEYLTNSIYTPFYMFASLTVLAGVYTLIRLPETKGKTLDEIQFMLKNEKPPPRDKETNGKF